MPDTLQPVTTSVLWRGAALLALLDAVAVPLVARVVPASSFRALRRPVVLATFLVWGAIWLGVVLAYWDSVYGYVFPARLRWLLPLLMGVGYAAASIPLFAIAARRPGYPSVLFVFLGALLGPVTHLFAVARGIVEKPPVLRGASPFAAVLVSFPEFAFYWCVILLLAALFHRIARARAAGA